MDQEAQAEETGGDTLPLTSSALSVGAMKTMNGESSAVRTILRVCGERGAVTRVSPSPGWEQEQLPCCL